MTLQKKILIGIGLALVTMFAISVVWAAPEDSEPAAPQAQQPRARRPGSPQRVNFQKRMIAMLKQRLNASDEKWQTIEPRLTKVMTLAQQAAPGPMMGRGRRIGAPRQGEQPDAPKNNVQKATEALQKTLEAQEPDTEDIKAKLLALRNARKKAKDELEKAQKELQKVLTIDQEAKLVLAGILE